MGFLSGRQRVAELMDDPGLDGAEHARALAGLARINAVSLTARQLLSSIVSAAPATAPIRILDLGCGGGDVTLRLWKLARARGLHLDVLGLDLSPFAVDYATRAAARVGAPVRFGVADVLRAELPLDYDVVMSSLFLHHLSRGDATSLLRRMAGAATRLLLLDDLVRSRTGWALAAVVPQLLTRSPIVHVDARRSARAAFTPAEVLDLAHEAGVRNAAVRRHFPSRLLLTGSPS